MCLLFISSSTTPAIDHQYLNYPSVHPTLNTGTVVVLSRWRAPVRSQPPVHRRPARLGNGHGVALRYDSRDSVCLKRAPTVDSNHECPRIPQAPGATWAWK
ncbi:hypothetical protein CVT25_000095 [Psilocybe cyanescens]|uniref:Uncharacterized protein n=1 Tax=Psilocybe cyanescens TaxID=93625 RepID=A0A409XKG6_PSICY|nr:hypothetical protein CVT25_000095 [Psilocybe cyanescens]